MVQKPMEEMTFEEGMEALEGVVRSLESGQMPLEDSFRAFERGMALQARLQAILDEGDKRIRVLTEDGERPMRGEE